MLLGVTSAIGRFFKATVLNSDEFAGVLLKASSP
jgi:hypothetical protein